MGAFSSRHALYYHVFSLIQIPYHNRRVLSFDWFCLGTFSVPYAR